MSYGFSSTPSTDIYNATFKNVNGYIMNEEVRVPTGQAWQVKQIIEGRYGIGSYIGASPIGSI